MAKKPTVSMAEVAQRAGTSTGTVSRVLNGGYVTESVRIQVLEAIRELDYRPKYIANRRYRVCVYLGASYESLGNPYFAAIISGLSSVFTANDIQMLVFSETKSDNRLIETARSFRPDILISIGGCNEQLEQMRNQVKGIIQIGTQDTIQGSTIHVCNNQQQGSTLAVEYLQQMGHRRICLLCWKIVTPAERMWRKGFDEQVQKIPGTVSEYLELNSKDEIYPKIMNRFNSSDIPTALVLSRPHFILPVYQAFYFMGKKIPDDVSIIGKEEADFGTYLTPPFTAITYDTHKTGEAAAQLALSLLEGKSLEKRVYDFPPQLCERYSVRAL